MGNLLSHRGNTLSFEQENFTRVGKALVGIGTKILQEILETYIQSKDLSFKLTSSTHPDLWRRLNPQQKFLISQAVTDGYKNFDITLCYTLLRNLNVNVYVPFKLPFPKPTRGWGNQPLATDTTQSDDIERIRILRNEMYGHLARPSIPNTKFADIWGQLKEVCTRTKSHNPNGTDFLKEISSLETCRVTKIQWNSVVELVQRNREHDKAIEAHTKRLDTLEAQQNVLNQDFQSASGQISEINTKIRMHNIRIDKLDIGNQTHSAQIDVQTRQISTMVTEAQTHGTKLDEHGLQIDENTSQLTRLNTTVNRHNIQTDEHARNLNTLDLEVKKQGEQIDGHSTKIDQYDRNISRLDTEVRGLVIQLEDQGKNIEKKRKELTTLGIRSQDHDAQIDEHTLQIATLDKGIQRHDRQIDEFSRKLTTLNSGVHEHRRHMENHSRQLVVLSSQYQSQKKEILEIKENVQSVKRTSATDVQRLKKRLEKINNDVTKVITLSPLQDRGENELPIELLYAQVVILEDNQYGEKSSLHYRKEVTHPSDVFMKNSEDIRRIYMLGDAAHGKTTYCLWLVKNWCNAQLTDRGHRDEWEKALQEFAFVFLLQFRKVNPRRDCVVDMICKDVFGDAEDCWDSIRYVLTSSKYKSLIIMDGLDEWNPNDETRKQLTYQGMPNIHVSSTVSCFFSMRPWVFSMITNLIKISDKVIEIQGLSLSGMEKVVENVLLNRYKLKDDIGNYLHTKKKIVNHLNEKNLISFMQIPLLAVICVQIWFEGIQVGDSMTSFYAVMINMLIERANEKYELQKYHDELIDSKLPEIFSKLGNVKRHSSALLRLGKVAHEGLLSSKINLVFQKRKLQIEIGVGELQFALDVGLISQMEAPSLLTKNVSVHFFHKSIQEFLAAFYIVSNKEVGDAFCKHLSNAKVIMELSNVIMFICGMCPSLGSAISQQVAYLIYSDMEICKYRESPYGGNSTLREIYKLQLSWYRDLQYGQTDREMTFHISDVYLSDVSDVETLRATRGLLFDDRVDIRSLYLQWIPTDNEHGITDSDLNYFLSNSHSTRSLVMVYVNGKDTDRSIHTICGPKLKTLYLVNVKMIDMLSVGRGCSPLLLDVTSLCELWLYGVQVGDRELGLSPDMVHLQKVDLAYVKMSTKCWQQFILSLQNVKHKFVAELYATNIDEVTKKNIRSSSDFNVTLDRLNEVTRLYELDFTRVWPLSQ